jgi:hypothetical protein
MCTICFILWDVLCAFAMYKDKRTFMNQVIRLSMEHFTHIFYYQNACLTLQSASYAFIMHQGICYTIKAYIYF